MAVIPVFLNTFDIDVNADTPSGAIPSKDVNSSINNSQAHIGVGCLRPAAALSTPVELDWVNVFSTPSGEIGSMSFWFRHNTIRGLEYELIWKYAASDESRLYFRIKNSGASDLTESYVRAHDNTGTLRVTHAETVGVSTTQADWHFAECTWNWNTPGGELTVKINNAHVGSSPYDVSSWSRSHVNGLIDFQTTLDNVSSSVSMSIYIDHLLVENEEEVSGRPLTLGSPLSLCNNFGR